MKLAVMDSLRRGPTYNHVSCTFECWRATGPHFSPNIGSPSVGKFNFARPLKCLPDYVHSEFSTLEIRIIIYCRRVSRSSRRSVHQSFSPHRSSPLPLALPTLSFSDACFSHCRARAIEGRGRVGRVHGVQADCRGEWTRVRPAAIP